MKFIVKKSRHRRPQYFVNLIAKNGRVLMTSETYVRKAGAIKIAKRMRTFLAMEWREIEDRTVV